MEQNLEERGVLNKLEGILRAEMFQALGQGYDKLPAPSKETRLINELIREYLQFNGYEHTLGVFFCEAHLPKTKMESSEIAKELGIDDRLLPKMYI
jgi:lisH domain-containing protein FOPNL